MTSQSATVPASPQSSSANSAGWFAQLSETQIFFAFYFCALVIRLVAALLQGINSPLISDEREYFEPALTMLHGQGFSHLWPDGVMRLSAYRVPGTSAFMCIGILLGGARAAAVRLTAVVFGSFAAPLLYLFARGVASRAASLLAGVACLLYPTWVFLSGSALAEPYFIPLMILSFLLTARAFRQPGFWYAVTAGVAWGATTLVRPHGAPMAAMIAVYLLLRGKWKSSVIFVAGFSLLVAPWLIRNKIIFGSPLMATESGDTLLGANNPYVLSDPALHGMWKAPNVIPEYEQAIAGNTNEVERNRIQSQMAKAYLKQNPNVIPRLVFYKLERWLTPITVSGGVVRLAVLGSYGLLLVLLAVGSFRGVIKSSVELHLVCLWSLLMAALTAVYWGNLTRGRLPLELAWLPWGAIAAFSVLHWLGFAKGVQGGVDQWNA